MAGKVLPDFLLVVIIRVWRLFRTSADADDVQPTGGTGCRLTRCETQNIPPGKQPISSVYMIQLASQRIVRDQIML